MDSGRTCLGRGIRKMGSHSDKMNKSTKEEGKKSGFGLAGGHAPPEVYSSHGDKISPAIMSEMIFPGIRNALGL